ncbi:MAG: hypothetical protein JWM47_4543 [Acidimicrobiales bacterium]|nr:hypothetical protein [Acidimicrobiales bacterium]
MPVNEHGQLITFAIERDADETNGKKFIWVHVTSARRTIAKIAAHRGHPEDAREIADLNKVRSIHHKLPLHKKIKLPGDLHANDVFHVLPQDGQPPTIVAGYAKFENIDRPERVGLTQFDGYDPISMTIPVQFENFRGQTGTGIERDIALLERMAGRGHFHGTAVGPPPIIHISTTNAKGEPIPLLPLNYQWSRQNHTAPLWRVTDIAWDEQSIRGPQGNRLRQRAVVTVQQHTHVTVIERSAAKRAKAKKS